MVVVKKKGQNHSRMATLMASLNVNNLQQQHPSINTVLFINLKENINYHVYMYMHVVQKHYGGSSGMP